MHTSNFELVREFHRAFDCPTALRPGWPSVARQNLRLDLIAEELKELRVALNERDMRAVADALGDLLYVVYGTGHEFGIQLDAVFAEVHRSNMSKMGADGKPIRRGDGKILKGPAFSPPDLVPVLALPNEPAAKVLR